MTSRPGSGDDNPFGNMPLFGDIARLLASQGPVNWDVARQLAAWVATDGQDEPNVDPVERIRFEELGRVAELHVSAATGMATSSGGGLLQITPVTRREWAARTLTAYRPLLEHLASALSPPPGDPSGPGGSDPGAGDDESFGPEEALLGDLGRMISPVLLGVQAGSMVGHLARRSLGQYDLPLPRPSAGLLVVPANLHSFTEEWSLPADDVALWVCLRELTLQGVLSRPHVDRRLRALLDEYVGGFRFDPSGLEAGLGRVDPSDPAGLAAIFGNPEALLGMLRSPAQSSVLERLESLTVPIVGYVDSVLESVGHGLIGSYGRLTEALRRRRAEESDGDRFVGSMLGLQLTRRHYERAHSFTRGVVERAGPEALHRLWASERELPTAAELDAPGLWLARIELPSA